MTGSTLPAGRRPARCRRHERYRRTFWHSLTRNPGDAGRRHGRCRSPLSCRPTLHRSAKAPIPPGPVHWRLAADAGIMLRRAHGTDRRRWNALCARWRPAIMMVRCDRIPGHQLDRRRLGTIRRRHAQPAGIADRSGRCRKASRPRRDRYRR